jgi:hypothetical protein
MGAAVAVTATLVAIQRTSVLWQQLCVLCFCSCSRQQTAAELLPRLWTFTASLIALV